MEISGSDAPSQPDFMKPVTRNETSRLNRKEPAAGPVIWLAFAP
jgi:hypothetical protein